MPLFRERPDLLSGFRRADRAALETVYWAYVDRVEHIIRYGFHRVGYRMSGAPESDVADVVQEVFAKAFGERARLSYDGLREFGPFLATIARNVLTSWLRKKGKPALPLEEDVELPSEPYEEPPWVDPAVSAVLDAYLAALPAALTAVHRERFELGRSQAAAAEALGLSRQQIRTLEQKLKDGLERALREAGLLARAVPADRDPQGPNPKKDQPIRESARMDEREE
jgi:RNA polymerase sigma factor (sigma-70 family)